MRPFPLVGAGSLSVRLRSDRGFFDLRVCFLRSCSTPPPFRADEKYPRGSFPRGGFPGAAFGARDRSLGRSIGGWLSVSCLVYHIFATFDSPFSGIQATPRSRRRARHRAGSLLGCPTTGTRPIF